MKETPLLLKADMVRAALSGSKTQTRRLVKLKNCHGVLPGQTMADVALSAYPDGSGKGWIFSSLPPQPNGAEQTKKFYPGNEGINCPYGNTGDRIWARETFSVSRVIYDDYNGGYEGDLYEGKLPKVLPSWACMDYRATAHGEGPWRPSIHMPRWASRLTLEVVDVRAERLAEISEEDAQAEGIEPVGDKWRNYLSEDLCDDPITSFRSLWESIYGDQDWKKNEWVWRIRFKKIENNGVRTTP